VERLQPDELIEMRQHLREQKAALEREMEKLVNP
jgi:hypothetical protein